MLQERATGWNKRRGERDGLPRKKRQLKADLRKAGFVVEKSRGKGSHTIWEHPRFPDITVALSGHDGDDADHYEEKLVRQAIAEVRKRLS